MKTTYLTPKQLSELIQVPVSVLAQWRCRGQGPVFMKLGGKHVRYSRETVESWLRKNQRPSTRPGVIIDIQSEGREG